MVTWRQLLAETAQALAAAGLPTPEVDARRVLERASGYEGTDLTLALERHASHRSVVHLDAMVARRRAGEPLQYVVGGWGFRSLHLLVDARALIPRPETEQVVERALAELDRRDRPGPQVVADLGTGTGAIALALAAERVTTEVWAVDASVEALALARANLAGLGRPATRVRLVHGDWFTALPGELAGTFDLIVSNPPYVAEGEDLPADVADWEPRQALVAGPTGREALEHLVARAPSWLGPGGSVVLELAPHQAEVLVARARSAGLVDAAVYTDLAGRDRVLVARRRS